jgi:hypothetical protein
MSKDLKLLNNHDRELTLIRELYHDAFGHRDRAFGASWTDPDGTDLSVMEYSESSGAILFDTVDASQAKLIRALLNFAARSAGCLLED